MRNNMEGVRIEESTLGRKTKFGVLSQTLTGDITLDDDTPPLVSLDPGGATRVVTLPAVLKGGFFFINNTADAVEDLTIKNAAAATLGTISQNEAGMVFSDGTSWFVRLVGTTT